MQMYSYVNRDHVAKEKLEQDRSKAQTTIPVFPPFHHSSIRTTKFRPCYIYFGHRIVTLDKALVDLL